MDETFVDTAVNLTCVPESFVPSQFRISGLIRGALWSLYIVLLLPLPFLASDGATLQISFMELGLAFVSGGVLLHMVLSETVQLDDVGIAVVYPQWVPRWLRRGWSLPWSEVVELKARSTGQGGLVYYLVSQDRRGYLLPMRIAGFSRMLRLIHLKTQVDIQDVKPLAQPWMYALLLGASGLMAIADGWIIWTALRGA